uniref:Sodium-dependent multivitamin transporter n=1 Tax=Cacopsylla melanoneura TaxID=428564 RepID=A0A8D9EQU1_9HEMI
METSFGIADYAVFITMLIISGGIGVYYRFSGGKQKTTNEYLFGNKNQSVINVAFSLMTNFMSAITLMGLSAENITYGTQFVVINISYILGTYIVSQVFLPVFYKLGALSVYEYLEKRFGRATRLAASFAFTVQMVLYMGIALYAPAIALEAVMGLSQFYSITLVGLVCLFYSTIGGIKAVIVTDVFQSLLMYAAIFAVIIMAAVNVGGIGEIWNIAERNGRIELFNFSLDPTVRHSWFSLTLGGVFIYCSLYGINQTQVQRYLTVKDYKTAVRCLWVSWPLLTLLSISTCFSGLSIYSAYYNCDPIVKGRISSTDQLLPLYVMDTMGGVPGLIGLFVAGIFSASLSTVSGACNSLAAVTVEDYIKPLYTYCTNRTISDRSAGQLSKSVTFFYGALCMCFAYLAKYMGPVLQAALTIFSIVGGPLLGLFTLGVAAPSANQPGVLTGLAAGLMFSSWLGFGGPKPPPKKLPTSIAGCPNNVLSSNFSTVVPFDNNFIDEVVTTISAPSSEDQYWYLFRISYMYYIVLGFLMTVLVGLFVSKFYKTPPYDVNLLTPWVAARVKKNGTFKGLEPNPETMHMKNGNTKDCEEAL